MYTNVRLNLVPMLDSILYQRQTQSRTNVRLNLVPMSDSILYHCETHRDGVTQCPEGTSAPPFAAAGKQCFPAAS